MVGGVALFVSLCVCVCCPSLRCGFASRSGSCFCIIHMKQTPWDATDTLSCPRDATRTSPCETTDNCGTEPWVFPCFWNLFVVNWLRLLERILIPLQGLCLHRTALPKENLAIRVRVGFETRCQFWRVRRLCSLQTLRPLWLTVCMFLRVLRVIESRWMRWAGNVARLGEMSIECSVIERVMKQPARDTLSLMRGLVLKYVF